MRWIWSSRFLEFLRRFQYGLYANNFYYIIIVLLDSFYKEVVKASETISWRRFLPKLLLCKRKIHDKGRKQFFPTVSIRSESVWNDFSEKVFVKIKMIHISMLSYSLNSVRKLLKWFLEKIFVKITQFRVCPSSVSIDYTLLLGARRSCGQSLK